MRRLLNQFIRFAGVGGAAFVIDYGLLIILTSLFGVFYMVSATISYIVSVVFNYAMSMRFVFSHRKDMSRMREFVIFVILSTIGLILTNIGMYVGVDICNVDYRITKIVATAMVTMFNFVTRRAFLDGANHERKQAKAAAAAQSFQKEWDSLLNRAESDRTESQAESEPQVEPEPVSESTSGSKSEVASEPTPESIPDFASGSTPESTPELVSQREAAASLDEHGQERDGS